MKAYPYYGLTHNPFQKESSHNVEVFDYKELMFRLEGLVQTKGLGVITGVSGSGKTHTLKQFADSLNPGLYKVCYFSMSTLTVMDFYRSLASGLGLEPRHRKIDLFKQIQGRIEELHDNQRVTPVIVLDESQYLKVSVLQDITMLLNFEMDSLNKCIVILSGLPNLNTTLTRAPLEPLRQRILRNYNMRGMGKKDLIVYIEEKLKSAGRETPLFEHNAYEALNSHAQGSVRKLDNLITQTMMIGELRNKKLLDAEDVFEANNEMTVI